ncbi:MAG: hypothetical protein LBD82_06645 [Deltaproteobacteria bacterium]|jgi:hypothetical protein|nr:hypothetical protein [Deltaproteobacteria bacterium]
MKNITLPLFIFFCLLSLTDAAYAAEVKIGGTSIKYNLPKGYVLAEGEAYAEFYSMLEGMMSQQGGMTLHAAYVSKETDRRYKAGEDIYLTRYLLLTHIRSIEDKTISAKDFQGLKDALSKNFSQIIESADLRDKVNQAIAQQGTDGVQVKGSSSLGLFGASDTQVSTLSRQTINLDNAEPLEQAIVMTHILAEKKIISLYQYLKISSSDEIAPFAEDALKVVKSMGFK